MATSGTSGDISPREQPDAGVAAAGFTPFPDALPAPITRERTGRRPRALLYSHDVIGLGHIGITATLAGALGWQRPDAVVLLATGSDHAARLRLPDNVDYLKLPAYHRQQLYAAVHPGRRVGPPGSTATLRESLLGIASEAFDPDVLLVDDTPFGAYDEARPMLARLRAGGPDVTLALGLRDIVDDPARTRPEWERGDAYGLFDHVYDRILVYGSREIFDPVVEYDMSDAAAAKVVFTGYLGRPAPPEPAIAVRARLGATDRPLVVVTAGGGQDGGQLLAAWVAAAARPELRDVVALVVGGPFLSARHQAELRAAAAGSANLHFEPLVPELASAIAAADLVVAMAGYSTICEILSYGRRAVVVPRSSPAAQQIRARRLAERGLLRLLHPRSLTPQLLAATARDALRADPPRVDLDLGGVARVVAELSAALPTTSDQ